MAQPFLCLMFSFLFLFTLKRLLEALEALSTKMNQTDFLESDIKHI